MEAASAAVATPKAEDRAPRRGSSAHLERDPVGHSDWSTLAGLPERYGPWPTVYSRFQRWRKAGLWDRLFAAVQQASDAAGELDWEVHYVDGTVVRAHQHAAGAKKGTLRPKR